MSAVQITGCSGAGKTTIAAALAQRGLAVIDADADPLLARDVDSTGAVVEEPAEPDFAWLARHSWAWDPGRLDELIQAAAPATLYVCGGADNELQVADRFTHVFLLEIDETTMLARIDARPDNDWGRTGDTREYLRRKLPELQDRLRACGAIPIDARQPLDHVVDAILAHMHELDPAAVMEAVTSDPRLRVFTGHGRIETLPARQARRLLLLDKIAQAFEPGVCYPERRVSLFLGALHADYAALRRYLVDGEFLSRSGGQYWRSGGTVLPSPPDEPRAPARPS